MHLSNFDANLWKYNEKYDGLYEKIFNDFLSGFGI